MTLPDDLYLRIYCRLRYCFPHRTRPEQLKARQRLHTTLAREEVTALPEALRELGRAWVKDAKGQRVPLYRNAITSEAYQLASEVEQWLGDVAGRAA